MLRIMPCHGSVSLRSPVVSFMVEAPRDRLFEIACASDARLFGSNHRRRRTRDNFFTSRREGWMRARSGATTYVMPSDALLALLRGRRIHYLLTVVGGDPLQAAFSTPPQQLEAAPWIPIIRDGAARVLAARRFGGSPPAPVLSWTGDAVGLTTRARAFDDDFDRDMDIGWDDDEQQQGPPPSGPAVPLAPSHVVRIEVRDPNGAVSKLTHEYPIEPGGALRMPRLPPIPAQGILIADLRRGIHEAVLRAQLYPRASVNVTLAENSVPYGIKLSPNDRVFIRMLDLEGNILPASGSYQLSTEGEIDLPFLGVIPAKELTIEQLQEAISVGLGRSSTTPPLIHVSATELP